MHEYISSFLDKNIHVKFDPSQNVYTIKPVIKNPNYKDCLLVVGPTGCGKTTIVKLFVDKYKDLVKRVVSNTTRTPRKSDPDKTEYNYVTQPEFEKMIQDNKLIEYIRYPDINGFYYGISRDSLNIEKIPLINCDMRGVNSLLTHAPDFNYHLIFICPESGEQLYSQLESRCHREEVTDPQKIVDERWIKAQREIYEVNLANTIVINRQDQLEKTITQLFQATLAHPTL